MLEIIGTNNAEIAKIDSATTLGLLGVNNSLSYRVHEVERHLHSNERWYGDATGAVGETHVAERIQAGTIPLIIDAGSSTWGSWLQILGSTDTPADAGSLYFDLHRILIQSAEKNETYFLQISTGETAAAGLSNLTYTEVVFQPLSNQIDSGPLVVQTKRYAVGTKVWARCLCLGQDTGTLNFYFGLHEYEG